jgi:hypothetical protein
MHRMRAALIGLWFLGVGCEPSSVTASVAATHGAADLHCTYESTGAYPTTRGTWIAQGCGGWAEYSCTRPYRTSGSFFWVYSTPAGSAMCNRIAVHEGSAPP